MSEQHETPVDGVTDAPVDGMEAQVHYLPARRGEAAPAAGEVLDGELVTEEEYQRLTSERAKAIERYRGYRHDVQVVVAFTRRVATHKTTKTAGRAVVRNVMYVPAGAKVLGDRVRDSRSNSRYERQMRSAEAAGDQTALQEWEHRAEQAKQRRHDRQMERAEKSGQLAKAWMIRFAMVLGGLVGLGVLLAFADHDITRVLDPINGVLDAVRWLALVVTMVWPFLLVGPWIAALGYLWHVGRSQVPVPAWAAASTAPTEQGGGRDVVPDEGAIVAALRNLNLPALNRKFREGWQPRWIQPAMREGKGWRAQLMLPESVPVVKIVDSKDVLAHNLLRLPVEVWPTEPRDKPGVLDLLVLDQGSLTKPVDPWPLLTDGTCDYFKGVPVGVNPEGRVVLGRTFQTNWGVAGTMGSGKSSLLITTLLGVMLDPLVEIDVYCMAFNADYDPLEPRLRTLFKSDEPDEIPKVLEALKTLMSELSERGRRLSEMGEPKLTRALAEADPRMRPRVVVIDECQELFVSDIGEEAAELVEKIVAKARKYGVTLIFATPVPSADSLPRKVAKVLSNKACFAIGDHQGNDALLGTGKHRAGITATTLRPMTVDSDGTVDLGDLGTAMTVGFMPRDGLMRCYYVPRGDGVDEVTPVVQRALALRDKAGITSQPAPPAITAAERDPLADIAAVLTGHDRMRTQEVLQRLTELDRDRYEGWTFTDLQKALPEAAKPYKSRVNGAAGVQVVSRTRVTESITERDEIAEMGRDDPEGDD